VKILGNIVWSLLGDPYTLSSGYIPITPQKHVLPN